LLVELLEQEEEHHGVHADPPDESLRVVAVDEEQLERVQHDGQELQHLQGGQVLLPPQVFLHVGAQGGQQVVRVHDYVDERVQQSEERAVATCWKIFEKKKPRFSHTVRYYFLSFLQ